MEAEDPAILRRVAPKKAGVSRDTPRVRCLHARVRKPSRDDGIDGGLAGGVDER